MYEYDILNSIKNIIGTKYIGDDCAYLDKLGIVVTQDSLVEDIHFKREWATPFQIGYKSVTVNISDILASGAIPQYITIALSLPNNLSEDFVSDFYKGAKSALKSAEIVGGDITGSSDKIVISITAIGTTKNRNISSRKNARCGYIVITSGLYGSSAAGLSDLVKNKLNSDLVISHLEPQLDYEFSNTLATTIKEPYAMMDTSDGLADALYKIAEASNIKLVIDYDKIPHLHNISKDFVLYGGEDYNLVAVIPESYMNILPHAVIIGKTEPYNGVRLDISGEEFSKYHELSVFNHFNKFN